MQRIAINPRVHWRQQAEEYGFTFHTIDHQPYWCEEAYYQFTAKQIDYLDDLSAELHQLCLQAVKHVVSSDHWLKRFAIPQASWQLIRDSWHTGQPALYSRFDFAWDGQGHARLLEYNADTPTSLFEAAFFQWLWLQDHMNAGQLPAGSDQFNSLHEKLIARFSELKQKHFIHQMHFCCSPDSDEDRSTVQYLQDCAKEAGITDHFLFIDQIGMNATHQFVDLDNHVISTAFKLYPWECMLREAFSTELPHANTRWIEPAWKSILSNKALLPLLWQMFPDHPALLPAWFADDCPQLPDHYVIKPLYSREGANVQIIKQGMTLAEVAGPYGQEGKIIQQYHPLPVFSGNHTVIGSWLINDKPAGIGIREDHHPITKDSSRFYPHCFIGK